MANSCQLTGKRHLVGNKVSHAKNRTKMTQKPNLHNKKFYDHQSKRTVSLKLSTHAIRTLDKIGSLPRFLKKYRHLLSPANLKELRRTGIKVPPLRPRS